MKRLTSVLSVIFALVPALCPAQSPDSLQFRSIGPVVDTLLAGKNILDVLPSGYRGDAATVSVSQSRTISDSMYVHIAHNSLRQVKGYRVRIYFSNAQNAREGSQAAQEKFLEMFPSHNAYRSFISPNFKVTVGDFPTKSEALSLKAAIQYQFPAAFVVREEINLTY